MLFVYSKMAKAKALSDEEKGQIKAFLKSGWSLRSIARELKRSLCVIQNFTKNPSIYGTKKASGRKRKLSSRDERNISRLESNSLKR